MYLLRVFFVAILALLLVDSSSAECGGDVNAFHDKCSNQCILNCELVLCPAACFPGCSCKKGYVFDNELGRCVLPEQCSSCNGDRNAYRSDCSNQCTSNCEDRACTLACVPGCSCKKGFVFDDKQGCCVVPSRCILSLNDLAECDARYRDTTGSVTAQ
ncbi:uncharacterized protein LOC142980378 [Anticarsia gemmatalis]|uniref:uncharacterized protein LOC142980378 n=1 Tax=Anticarsia gemmatalis TaxID=129554 RepID=UPI003F769050